MATNESQIAKAVDGVDLCIKHIQRSRRWQVFAICMIGFSAALIALFAVLGYWITVGVYVVCTPVWIYILVKWRRMEKEWTGTAKVWIETLAILAEDYDGNKEGC